VDPEPERKSSEDEFLESLFRSMTEEGTHVAVASGTTALFLKLLSDIAGNLSILRGQLDVQEAMALITPGGREALNLIRSRHEFEESKPDSDSEEELGWRLVDAMHAFNEAIDANLLMVQKVSEEDFSQITELMVAHFGPRKESYGDDDDS